MPESCRNYRDVLLAMVLFAAAAAALAIDVPVALALNRWHEIAKVRAYLGYLDMFEPFGHGLGLVLVLIILHQLDPGRRWAIPRVLLCALAAGGAADLLKMVVLRTRPYDLSAAFAGPVWATFVGWLPGPSGNSGTQSFPSAHTATAVGLAAALVWLYPNGRWLFAALALLVGCQRIAARAHYPSDMLIGAATGCLVATFFLHVGRLPAWFDRWETRWGKYRTPHAPRDGEPSRGA
jgi:membrane-associated phospholipid phosphatase